MPNRFVDLNGDIKKGRPQGAIGQAVASKDDLSDPERLADTLKDIMRRLAKLEEVRPNDWTEFEVQCGTAGATISLPHNFECPVRYSVVHWKGSAAHALTVNETSSTNKILVLNSYVAGRAVVRVEKSQYGVVKGT